MPASAGAIRRLAHATCTDLMSMTAAATTAPVVVVPVMNAVMWNHAAVQRNVGRLRDDGVYVVEPTLIFKAATLTERADPMYGGPGTFWRGPLAVMQTLSAIMAHKQKLSGGER
jgi:phosphopantothenoylcysteine synthetase/decarboxylase